MTFIRSAVVVSLLAAAPASAQVRLGLGGGLAGVENFDPVTPLVSAHVLVPMGAGWSFLSSYSRWFGSADAFGNQGINVGVQRDVVAAGAARWSVGVGLGEYERTSYTPRGVELDSYFIGGVTLSTLLDLDLNDHLGLFLRGDLSAPTGHVTPDWGLAVVGVEWRP